MCIFPQFSHKDSVRRVSAYQTWVFLYPAFQFSIDLGRVTLKHPEKHRSTKTSSLPLFHQKDSLGPRWFHSQARYWCRPGFITWWLEPERNRRGAKYQIAFGSKLSGLVPVCHPSYHLSLSLSLCQALFLSRNSDFMVFKLEKVIAESLKQPVPLLIHQDIRYVPMFKHSQ